MIKFFKDRIVCVLLGSAVILVGLLSPDLVDEVLKNVSDAFGKGNEL